MDSFGAKALVVAIRPIMRVLVFILMLVYFVCFTLSDTCVCCLCVAYIIPYGYLCVWAYGASG